VTKIVIEKGLPLICPQPRGARQDPDSLKGTMRRMDVGDSILPPTSAATTRATAAIVNREFPDRRYVCRKVDGGVRVWRVA
jgi:hypothetical protein